MKKFVKITTREGDAIIRSWVDIDIIVELHQNSITQQGNNEGTLIYYDDEIKDNKQINIINFGDTIDSLY